MRTYSLDSINKTVILTLSFDEDIIREIKALDYNSRWNQELKHWVVPVNDYSINLISALIKEYNFTKAEIKKQEDVDISYEKTEVDLAYLKGMCDSKGFTYTPRDYQLEALGFGIEKGNIINGDDVGLGKTFEAIMYAETTNSFPCLVIVPASVKYNWYEKWLEITGEKRNVSVIESKETKKHKNNWNADVVIINYDILGKKQGRGTAMKFAQLVETNWGMVVIDEAHFLKNKTSQRAQAAKKITQISDDVKIQLLTGTATMSKPVELWNLLKLCKVDEFIAVDWYQFVRRYCGGYKGKFGWVTDGATNTLELNKKLRETCYIRREKREVLTEMPDVTKQVIQMAISNLKDITAANTNFIQYIIDTKGEEAAEAAMEAEHLVALGMMRKLAIEGKAKAIELYLKDWKESGKKLVVFGIHKELLIHLAEKFKCPLIAGGVSSKQKQEIVKHWIKSDDIFLFANMESAGTGVDGLQLVCSNMLIIELPWRPSDLTQVIGRLDRSGQEEPVTVTFALSDDTIDSEMFEMLADKELVTEAVNKGIDIKRNGSGMRAVMKKIMKKIK
tara:strand:+ start:736 stop:2421 length:1686 start_codon:yes stop_codon:yes gene_type:complete